jgi:signal recognition particle GTPase
MSVNNNISSNKTTSDTNEQDEIESQQPDVNNEEMLKRLINTAMATRKTNASNTFLENLPANLLNNNVAASLATLLGQLTNKQLLQQQQQQFQSEKTPLAKRYKCSLCSHISAWGGNVKKHLKRMHPGDHSGHVIDLGAELPTPPLPLTSIKDESQIFSTNSNKIQEQSHHSYQQV